ncbi:MAG: zinc-ribbon domain-containing protein [Planctomycetota bacterium]|nr:MAG: zinc-ribbon domain-containing protein [Planctomycetota bacterium]
MQCPSCGTDVPESSLFCPKCGTAIAGSDDEAQPAPPPEPKPQPAAESSTAAQRFRETARERLDRPEDDDEEEMDLWKGGYSGKAMVGTWILLGLITVVLLVGAVMLNQPWGWIAWLVVTAAMWLWSLCVLAYRKMSVDYLLTSQRFIHKSGILKRRTDRIEVIDIDDVTYEQGIIERMFGIGTIRISSSDRTHPELKLRGIADVRRVADLIDDVRRKERRRRGLHIEAI